MLRGHGEDRLRQAIMQGLIRDDIAADVDEVLRQIEAVKRSNKLLNDDFCHQKKELDRFKQIYYDAIRDAQRAQNRKRRNQDAISYAMVAGTIFIIVLLSMMICRLIFGYQQEGANYEQVFNHRLREDDFRGQWG